ncbi:MAG TPA: hypothetical protein VGX46_17230, partial [Vicinamibacterales bacterium]|nr:hypothetical protein [Vicinamibacterales bacterium]
MTSQIAVGLGRSLSRARTWQQLLPWVSAALAVWAIFLRGERAGIDRHVSNRLRFHAIPMAISVLYHAGPHDYTGFSSIAIPFQDTSSDLDAKISAALKQNLPAHDSTYYWVADDRGMGDYVIAAFVLFGPRTESLYLFYFVVLGMSVILFLADLGRQPIASAMLIFALGALYTCTLVIPLANLTLPVFEPGSLYEPRLMELLSYVAALHLALTAWFGDRWTVARRAIVAAQALILMACYHARSTVGWELAFVLASVAARWLWPRRSAVGSGASARRSMALSAAWPVLCVVVAFGLLKTYQRLTYNPRYFRDMGGRTVWHNALMGLSFNEDLAKKYQLQVNDGAIVEAVRTYLRESRDPRLTPEWTDNNILGALGGYTVFNWFIYEETARDFYRHIWRAETPLVLHCYLIDKPAELAYVFVQSTKPD